MATNKIKYTMKNENKIELTAEGRDEFKPTTLKQLIKYAQKHKANVSLYVVQDDETKYESIVFKFKLSQL